MDKSVIRKILILSSIVIFISLNNLFAISPSSDVLSIGQDDDVGLDIFPVSSVINYDVFAFPINKKYPLNFEVQIFGGYESETIKQNPTTGFADWCDGFESLGIEGDTYGKIFSGGEFKFSQTLPISDSIPGKLSFWTSYSTRFERPVDLVDYWSTAEGKSIFLGLDGTYNVIWNGTLLGTPELQGNKYLNTNAINSGLSYSYNVFELPYTLSLKTYYAPSWFFNESSDTYGGESDYLKLVTNCYISKTLVEYRYNDLFTNKDSRLFELKLSNSLSYRYLNGTAVPMFVQDYDNLRHNIIDTIKLSAYGPQIFTNDTYLSGYLYYKANYEWGRLNNTDYKGTYPSNLSFSHSINLDFNMRIIGIIHIAWKNSLDLLDFNLSIGTPYLYINI